ncbi:hypothetical protein DL96DRAFT_1701981 [Flagelloscypha sp. PMI_526]|nr:hypothetical protein DL96DRAFT_1701981 [Flagelloscypha sp. PMI_526]
MPQRPIDDGEEGRLLNEVEEWSIENPDNIWRRSPSPPEEEFSDDEYEHKILSEKVGPYGHLRYAPDMRLTHRFIMDSMSASYIPYQIDWAPKWKRMDGTSNTYDPSWMDEGLLQGVKDWSKKKRKQRQNFVEQLPLAQLSMELDPWKDKFDLAEVETKERGSCYEEMLERLAKEPFTSQPARNFWDEDSDSDSDSTDSEHSNIPPPPPPRRQSQPRSVSSSSRRSTTFGRIPRSLSSHTIPSPNLQPMKRPLDATSSTSRKRRKSQAVAETDGDDPESLSTTLYSQSRSDTTRVDAGRYTAKQKGKGRAIDTIAEKLSKTWTQVAESCQAAPVTLCPRNINNHPFDTDEEARDFVYLENNFSQEDIARYAFPPEIITMCKCIPSNTSCCVKPEFCDCQDESEIVNKANRKAIAYNEKGLYAFHSPIRGTLVIECNNMCTCFDRNQCPNRVSQRPRTIPIEVFETGTERGWGVRSPEQVEKGQVLGLYIGELVSRKSNKAMSMGQYMFDIDVSHDPNLMYHPISVNAFTSGNWTRFTNHSCSPNVAILQVRNDLRYPYLALVSVKRISPGTEFTIDYNPAYNDKKKKGAGEVECLCEAANCRGWIF